MARLRPIACWSSRWSNPGAATHDSALLSPKKSAHSTPIQSFPRRQVVSFTSGWNTICRTARLCCLSPFPRHRRFSIFYASQVRPGSSAPRNHGTHAAPVWRVWPKYDGCSAWFLPPAALTAGRSPPHHSDRKPKSLPCAESNGPQRRNPVASGRCAGFEAGCFDYAELLREYAFRAWVAAARPKALPMADGQPSASRRLPLPPDRFRHLRAASKAHEGLRS